MCLPAELKDTLALSRSSLNSENPYATIKDLPGLPFCPPESSYMEMKAAVPRERAYTEIRPPPDALLRRGERITRGVDRELILSGSVTVWVNVYMEAEKRPREEKEEQEGGNAGGTKKAASKTGPDPREGRVCLCRFHWQLR